MFGIDDALAEVVASATQPALAAVKLAWWRENLEKLDLAPPPAEPRLQAASAELLTRQIKGSDLSSLEEGWATLLDEVPDRGRVRRRGEALFGLAARLLGQNADEIEQAGAMWAEVDVARRFGGRLPAAQPVIAARRALRPLAGLAVLAWRDLERGGAPFEPEATPGRAWTLLRHRITGR